MKNTTYKCHQKWLADWIYGIILRELKEAKLAECDYCIEKAKRKTSQEKIQLKTERMNDHWKNIEEWLEDWEAQLIKEYGMTSREMHDKIQDEGREKWLNWEKNKNK